MKKRTKILLGIFFIFLAAPIASANNYALLCIRGGESINFKELCNPAMPIRHGPGNYCVKLLPEGKVCPAPPNICNGLGLSCSNSSGGGSMPVDVTPPKLTISSPLNNSVFMSKSILLDITSNEIANIYFRKASETRWTTLCTSCLSHSKRRNFDEGLNEIVIRAVDRSSNEAIYNIQFRIDSKRPQFRSFSPSTGFASGAFTIRFAEENPKSLILHYGNVQTGYRNRTLNLKTECSSAQTNDFECSVQLDLLDYDGQRIETYASLTDIAENSAQTTTYFLDVDNLDPVIESLNFTVQGKKATFMLEIDEPYFAEATYLDRSEINPREKTLCSKLTNNLCEKSVTFNNDGEHEIIITVRDLAGNRATRTVNFLTDSQKPKIKSTNPSTGFASGIFEVSFTEQNPKSVVLEYGNLALGFKTKEIPIKSCQSIGAEYFCSTSEDLGHYEGEQIEYKFKITDLAGQSDEKRQNNLRIDNSYPVINSITYTTDKKNVFFSIDIKEANLKEITYIDNLEPNSKEKLLCNRLINGLCEKKISFRLDGEHDITIKVEDLAGHITAKNVEFFTDAEKPKITKVSPEKGFTSGLFEIEFIEENLVSLVLEYGNSALGFRKSTFSPANDCTPVKNGFYCSKKIDLSYYEGYEIGYTFTATDRAEQTAVRGNQLLQTDVTYPVFVSINYEMDGLRRAAITVSARENNLDKITYINHDEAGASEREFCRTLSHEGTCTKKLRLVNGANRFEFRILDKAGNSAVQQIVINA